MRYRRIWLAAGLAAILGGCSSGGGGSEAGQEIIPAVYRVRFETSKGDFVVEVYREWAPEAALRFHQLVAEGYFNGNRIFRVLPGFVAQWGINGDPAVTARWRMRFIADDPVRQSNARGYVSFAKSQAPNSRSTQVFVNLADNPKLDTMGFAPFGKVIQGMEVVDSFYAGYGEGPPAGNGPRQDLAMASGNAYFVSQFPSLDFIRRAMLEK